MKKKNTGANNNINVSNHVHVHGCSRCGDHGEGKAKGIGFGRGCLSIILLFSLILGVVSAHLWHEYSMLLYQYFEYWQTIWPFILEDIVWIAAKVAGIFIVLLGWVLLVFQPHIVWHWGGRK